MWKMALSAGWVISLWRDEVLHIHTYIEKHFERIKGEYLVIFACDRHPSANEM